MREKLQNHLPSVLALTFVALLIVPLTAAAASGLPATVSMNPASAAPGATVEVTGLEFPGLDVVELHLATSAGRIHLLDTVTADSGYFREVIALPADVAAGTWEVQASALDGSTASHRFDAAAAASAALAAGSTTTAVAGSGNSGANVVFMLVIAGLLAAVGGSVVHVVREVRRGDRQPGMGAGDDPIWSGPTGADVSPDLTAVDEPVWMAAHSES
jgi:hypothetical protein